MKKKKGSRGRIPDAAVAVPGSSIASVSTAHTIGHGSGIAYVSTTHPIGSGSSIAHVSMSYGPGSTNTELSVALHAGSVRSTIRQLSAVAVLHAAYRRYHHTMLAPETIL
eukprot:1163169-Rhodomonas_salina.1